MDVRIGVIQNPKEIMLELAEGTDADGLAAELEAKLAAEHGVLWLTDRRGRRVAIPSSRVAYIELDAGSEDRRVGFGTGLK